MEIVYTETTLSGGRVFWIYDPLGFKESITQAEAETLVRLGWPMVVVPSEPLTVH
jgi:hypothetical protein